MFVSDNLGINTQGHLTIGEMDTVALAEKYGTPLYLMDENKIRQCCQAFQKSIDDYYDGQGLVCFASKAFSCKEIYRVMQNLDMGIDIVSAGEMYTAAQAGFDLTKACFHGNNKTIKEIEMALDYRVGRIVVDNIYEMERLNHLAAARGITAPILLRITPGVDAHTHNFIRTGQIDSKFGFTLETGEALEAVKKALDYSNLELRGLHCHIGSQILDTEGFVAAAETMMNFIEQIKDKFHYETHDLNLGGGFGICYTETDDPPKYDVYMHDVTKTINVFCAEHGIKRPFILIEPGRSIVAPAGITLYTVGGKKIIPNVRTYVSVDGGMCDNPRYILYQSAYDVLIANKANEEKTETVTVAGKCCESGDLIGENMLIQPCDTGDILAVCATGAYNYSMASNYNRLQKPAVVFVADGVDRLAVKRETLDDLIRCDV